MLSLVVTVAVIGVIVWALTTYLPMDARIKQIIVIVAIICVVVYVLSAFGILGGAHDIPVPQVR